MVLNEVCTISIWSSSEMKLWINSSQSQLISIMKVGRINQVFPNHVTHQSQDGKPIAPHRTRSCQCPHMNHLQHKGMIVVINSPSSSRTSTFAFFSFSISVPFSDYRIAHFTEHQHVLHLTSLIQQVVFYDTGYGSVCWDVDISWCWLIKTLCRVAEITCKYIEWMLETKIGIRTKSQSS